MADPISIRFSDALYDRLKDQARRTNLPASTLVQRYVDEGIRTHRHPGVVFRDGPSGRRAGLVDGPDIWEVAALIKHLGVKGNRAVRAAVAASGLTERQVRSAVAYWADFREEVDAEVAAAERESLDAEERLVAQHDILGY